MVLAARYDSVGVPEPLKEPQRSKRLEVYEKLPGQSKSKVHPQTSTAQVPRERAQIALHPLIRDDAGVHHSHMVSTLRHHGVDINSTEPFLPVSASIYVVPSNLAVDLHPLDPASTEYTVSRTDMAVIACAGLEHYVFKGKVPRIGEDHPVFFPRVYKPAAPRFKGLSVALIGTISPMLGHCIEAMNAMLAEPGSAAATFSQGWKLGDSTAHVVVPYPVEYEQQLQQTSWNFGVDSATGRRLTKARKNGATFVRHQWVLACIAHGTIVPYDDYVMSNGQVQSVLRSSDFDPVPPTPEWRTRQPGPRVRRTPPRSLDRAADILMWFGPYCSGRKSDRPPWPTGLLWLDEREAMKQEFSSGDDMGSTVQAHVMAEAWGALCVSIEKADKWRDDLYAAGQKQAPRKQRGSGDDGFGPVNVRVTQHPKRENDESDAYIAKLRSLTRSSPLLDLKPNTLARITYKGTWAVLVKCGKVTLDHDNDPEGFCTLQVRVADFALDFPGLEMGTVVSLDMALPLGPLEAQLAACRAVRWTPKSPERLLDVLGPSPQTQTPIGQQTVDMLRSHPDYWPLNDSQATAILDVLFSAAPHHYWHGPPGTGKTTTMEALAAAISSDRHVEFVDPADQSSLRIEKPLRSSLEPGKTIVTSPSNAAVDLACAKFRKSARLSHLEIVRVGDDDRIAEENEEVSLETKAAALRSSYAEDARRLEESRRGQRWAQVEKEAWTESEHDAHRAYVEQKKEIEGKLRQTTTQLMREIIAGADFVFVTLASLRRVWGLLSDKAVVEAAIIDEAGMATEGETLGLLIDLSPKKIVVMGDPDQLPPFTHVSASEAFGYKKSFLGRAIENGVDAVLLNTQYRCHPLIAEIWSRRCYDGKVVSPSGLWSEKARPWHDDWGTSGQLELAQEDAHPGHAGWALGPNSFVGVKGGEVASGTSWENPEQAAAVAAVLRLVEDQASAWGETVTVGVITPYIGQRDLLRRELRSFVEDESPLALNVDTVDAFQGSERDVIILSTVRTSSLGFVADLPRANVAISRARVSLVTVGHEGLLCRSEGIWDDVVGSARLYDRIGDWDEGDLLRRTPFEDEQCALREDEWRQRGCMGWEDDDWTMSSLNLYSSWPALSDSELHALLEETKLTGRGFDECMAGNVEVL